MYLFKDNQLRNAFFATSKVKFSSNWVNITRVVTQMCLLLSIRGDSVLMLSHDLRLHYYNIIKLVGYGNISAPPFDLIPKCNNWTVNSEIISNFYRPLRSKDKGLIKFSLWRAITTSHTPKATIPITRSEWTIISFRRNYHLEGTRVKFSRQAQATVIVYYTRMCVHKREIRADQASRVPLLWFCISKPITCHTNAATPVQRLTRSRVHT